MLKAGMEFIGETAVEQLLRRAVSTDKVPDYVSEEQKIFDRQIRMAQTVLGLVCPPAGRAVTALEYGPVIIADVILCVRDKMREICHE